MKLPTDDARPLGRLSPQERATRLRYLGLQVAVIASVLVGVSLALIVVYEIRRVLVWLLVSVFFAAVLSPLVGALERRRIRHGVAVGIVMVGLFVVIAGAIVVFAQPVVTQANEFVEELPSTIERLRDVPVIRPVLDRIGVRDISSGGDQLATRLPDVTGPALSIFRGIGEAIVGLVTIIAFTVFLLLYGPTFARNANASVPGREHREHLERIADRSLHAVSGWVAGNVATSGIAAVASIVAFLLLGLPYAVLLGLWVGFADLIPLVGATLGAIPAVAVAFVHSTTSGIVTVVFFVLYQQFENHVLQPAVYGRTIKLNPFLVLLAVIVGVELMGFWGALLALPVAGVIQVTVAEYSLAPAAFLEDPSDEEESEDAVTSVR